MEGVREELSEAGDAEDIPSDFFDDFNKAEFMEGLSVIDECWDENSATLPRRRNSRTRIDIDAVDSVKDLRELIGDNDDECSKHNDKKSPHTVTTDVDSDTIRKKPVLPEESALDDFIKPGSRRDLNKTNEAIKKDKEIKVQQFLAKSLEASIDDLRPPGTELDDYFENDKKTDKRDKKKRSPSPQQSHNSSRSRRSSPPRQRYSPRQRRSPQQRSSPRSRHNIHGSPRRNRKSSPLSFRGYDRSIRRFSPSRIGKRNHSPSRRSPVRRSPVRRSPARRSPLRRSPRRYSPSRHSPHRQQRSRSPRRRSSPRRLRSRSRSPHPDNFLYPNSTSGYQGTQSFVMEYGQQYYPSLQSQFSGGPQGYNYPQAPAYGVGFPETYDYGASSAPIVNAPVPAIMPNMPVATPEMVSSAPPAMVPAPPVSTAEKPTPYDALAQLVAEGKISQEDYLKLTPNKGVATPIDTNTRVMVLTRCQQAISKLDKLFLPNRLTVNNHTISDDKYLAPKYCSPLKRQIITEFNFTQGSASPEQQTKKLVESIISTLGLDKVVSKYKKKLPKNMKDGIVQTTKVHCEVCEIRESTMYHDVGTSIDPEYFTSTVHTQVVEQDLMSSRAIFNPSGSVGEGAAISIAHLTPAQLVSQLAARAKTLKQPQEPSSDQFMRRQNYDYDGRGGQQYHHSYHNYRY